MGILSVWFVLSGSALAAAPVPLTAFHGSYALVEPESDDYCTEHMDVEPASNAMK